MDANYFYYFWFNLYNHCTSTITTTSVLDSSFLVSMTDGGVYVSWRISTSSSVLLCLRWHLYHNTSAPIIAHSNKMQMIIAAISHGVNGRLSVVVVSLSV